MTKITGEEIGGTAPVKRHRGFAIPTPVYSIFGAIAALAAIIYFIDLKPLFAVLYEMAHTDYFDKAVLSGIYNTTKVLNFDFSFVAMAALVLIIIGGIDYIVRHYKQRTASFFV